MSPELLAELEALIDQASSAMGGLGRVTRSSVAAEALRRGVAVMAASLKAAPEPAPPAAARRMPAPVEASPLREVGLPAQLALVGDPMADARDRLLGGSEPPTPRELVDAGVVVLTADGLRAVWHWSEKANAVRPAMTKPDKQGRLRVRYRGVGRSAYVCHDVQAFGRLLGVEEHVAGSVLDGFDRPDLQDLVNAGVIRVHEDGRPCVCWQWHSTGKAVPVLKFQEARGRIRVAFRGRGPRGTVEYASYSASRVNDALRRARGGE
jgi:hypothetical protein